VIKKYFLFVFLLIVASGTQFVLPQAYLEEVRACRLLEQGQAEEALKLVESKLKRYPRNYDCLLYKGLALYFLGDQEEAFKVLEKVEFETEKLAKAGGTLEAGKRLQAFSQEDMYLAQRGGVVFTKKRKGLLKYALGILDKRKKDYKRARKHLEEALKAEYLPDEARRQLCLINCFLKDYKEGEKIIQPLLASAQKEATVSFLKAYLDYYLGRQKEARKSLEELADHFLLARKDLACLLYNDKQYQESLAIWESLVEENPKDIYAQRNRARCYFYLGEKEKAQQIFDDLGLKLKVEKYSPPTIPLILEDLFPQPRFDFLCDIRK